MKEIGIKGKYLVYKDKPLVRQGNELIYGDLSDGCYLSLMIMKEKQASSVEVSIPATVLVTIYDKDGKVVNGKQKMVTNGLYEAFDLGCAWLERQLKA